LFFRAWEYKLRLVKEGKFKEAYERLNLAQREAVDTIEGPVMVIAGPGTGKTQILTLRIANIVQKTDTEPENILALTFTEAGVASMRKRLVEMMGGEAYAVSIKTFHGFSNDIIKAYPEYFPRVIGSDAVTDSERVKIIEDIIDNTPLKEIRPFGDRFHYLKDIIGAISDLKREGVDVDEFADLIKKQKEDFELIEDLYHNSGKYKGRMRGKYLSEEKYIKRNEELILVYGSYEKELAEKKLYDYEDMIMETLKALRKNEDLLLSLQEKNQYILADEHQDSNRAQNRILELLAGFYENPNIFVVGDEKQAIFRFQGASLDNFYYFKNLYSGAKLITLEDNYRSTQEILDSAHSLISGEKELRSNKGNGTKLKVYPFLSNSAEEYFLADDIKKRIDNGEDPGEIAVLFKENKDGFAISNVFSKYGIPHVLESDNDLLTVPDIKKIVSIIKAVAGDNTESEERELHLIEAMHISSFGLEPFDIYKIISKAREDKLSIADIIGDEKKLSSLGLKDADRIKEFYKKICKFKVSANNDNLMEAVDFIIIESGIIEEIMKSSDAMERLGKINDFFNHVRNFSDNKRFAELKDLVMHIDTMISHGISMKSSGRILSSGKVRLMTAHRSKGQEFNSVYITKTIDGHWGNKRIPQKIKLPESVYSVSGKKLEKDEKLDDERRLFYVAITRAKKDVSITYSEEGSDGREQLPSVFLSEIREDMLDYCDTDKWNKGPSEHIKKMFASPPKEDPEKKIKDLVGEMFEQKGLSATAVNNYLECPWRYFYTNLFRIPEAEKNHLIYGTAVHAALKDLFDSIKDRGADKIFLLSRFDYYLSKKPLRESDYSDLLEKGKSDLSAYFDQRSPEWDKDYFTEFNISGVELAPGVLIKGRIDRMEVLGFSNDVNVTDFKTGKVKSENEIRGKTKNSNGNIMRQLLFYKLLLDEYKGGKYKMVSADIDFIEPDNSGKCRNYKFAIDKEEAEALKEEIKRVADEIKSLSFWDKRCGDDECPYCKLRENIGL